MSNTPVEPSLWYRVECLVPDCDWARTYRGSGAVPTCPHALHFIETGHDKLTSGLVGARVKAPDYQIPIELSAAEWAAAVAFSAGVTYGSVYTGRDIKKRVLAALPDDDHLAKGRERDERTLEEVEAYKQEAQKPTPQALWQQAKGDSDEYLTLMLKYGYLKSVEKVPAGEEGSDG